MHANTECGDVAFLHAAVECIPVNPSSRPEKVRPDISKAVARKACTTSEVT